MKLITPPTCRGCRRSTVSADAGIFKSIPYWYCRTCKCEVDDFGREVIPHKNDVPHSNGEVLGELNDYLSGEIGRFDNEGGQDMDFVSVYDPFLKRSRKMSRKDARSMTAPKHAPDQDDDLDDDYDGGFWDPTLLPETF